MLTQIPNNVFKSSEYFRVRQELIDWLSNQDEFKDYDFAGSRLSVLIDLLAYNTLYIQHFTNSAIYESFIRTAKLRSSVVQHAQDSGYLPDSKSASITNIAVEVSHPSSPRYINIPKGTKFVGIVDNTYNYDFVTWEDVTIILNDMRTAYNTRLDLVQGRIVRTSQEFSTGNRIEIQNKDIDRNYVRVYVDNDEWTNRTNESMVNTSSIERVFYMRETLDGYTEIYFGEGESDVVVDGGALKGNYVGGLKPPTGSIVTVEYIATSGEEANGSRNIKYVDSLPDLTFNKITENPDNNPNYTGSIGGGGLEDIERIRELSSTMKETQRRCVTASDYESFVSYRFGSIVQAIQAFTDKDKPGYAFIAIKPQTGLTLTTVQKEDIQEFLSKFNIASITPIVIDPKYMYIKHNINVQYKLSNLTESEEWLRGKILSSIDRYYIENVEIFNKSFHSSKLLSYIDNSDQSILGSTIDIKLIREEANFYKTPMAGIKFLNQVAPMSIYSSEFTFTNSDKETYGVRYAVTAKNSQDEMSGKVIVGPFKKGDITSIQEYTGDDFIKNDQPDRTTYYAVGDYNYVTDKMTFNLGILTKEPNDFGGAYIEIEAQPLDKNVYVKDGSLIVFENDLRPQYTKINMEPITL